MFLNLRKIEFYCRLLSVDTNNNVGFLHKVKQEKTQFGQQYLVITHIFRDIFGLKAKSQKSMQKISIEVEETLESSPFKNE